MSSLFYTGLVNMFPRYPRHFVTMFQREAALFDREKIFVLHCHHGHFWFIQACSSISGHAYQISFSEYDSEISEVYFWGTLDRQQIRHTMWLFQEKSIVYDNYDDIGHFECHCMMIVIMHVVY